MTIITVCGDPGGARAVTPVINALQKISIQTVNYAYNEAVAILKQHEITSRALPLEINDGWISEELQHNNAALLLTATSHNHLNWEKFFIRTAKKLSIQSFSILDFWSNYRMRFSDTDDNLVYLPDKIAVMDNKAKEEMINVGIAAERIMVTGQPAFDKLAIYRNNFSITKKQQLRAKLKVKNNGLLVIFVSQPLRKLYNEFKHSYLGYDEKNVLKKIIHSLEMISKNNNKAITLCIRPHPREASTDYMQYQSKLINIVVSMEDDAQDYLMSSDLVVGMNSVLLVEACYLHCIVMSVQPGLINTDILPTNELGMSIGVYQEDDIVPTLEKILLDDAIKNTLLAKTKTFFPYLNATNHIVDYIQSMTSSRIK